MTKKSTKHFVKALIWNQDRLPNFSQHELERTVHVDVLTNGRVVRGPRATVGPSPRQLNQNQVPTWSGSKNIYYEFAVNLTIYTRDTLIQRLPRLKLLIRYIVQSIYVLYYFYSYYKQLSTLNFLSVSLRLSWFKHVIRLLLCVQKACSSGP